MEGLFSQPAKDRLVYKADALQNKIISRFEFEEAKESAELSDTQVDIAGILNDKDGLLVKMYEQKESIEENKGLDMILSDKRFKGQQEYQKRSIDREENAQMKQEFLEMAKQSQGQQPETLQQEENVEELEDFLDDII